MSSVQVRACGITRRTPNKDSLFFPTTATNTIDALFNKSEDTTILSLPLVNHKASEMRRTLVWAKVEVEKQQGEVKVYGS